MRRRVVDVGDAVHGFEDGFALLAFEADGDELAGGEAADEGGDAGDPGEEGVGGEVEGEGLGLVGELPGHDRGVFLVGAAIYGIRAGDDGLDVIFEPGVRLVIRVHFVRKISKLGVRVRAVEHGGVVAPAGSGDGALRGGRHVPRRGVRDGGVVAGPGDVLGEAAGPLPLVVEGHGGAHAAFGKLIEADVEAGEELFVVDARGGHEGWVHAEGLGGRGAFGGGHDTEVVHAVGLGRGDVIWWVVVWRRRMNSRPFGRAR